MLGKGMISCLQAYHNHAGDKDLKQIIDDMTKQTEQEVCASFTGRVSICAGLNEAGIR